MTQERREDHDDGDREYHDQRRPPRVVAVYTFAVNGRLKPPAVRGNRFWPGSIVATSDGPHKVVEVFWFSDAKARVLLRLVEEPKKVSKAAQPKKFNVKGTQTSRLPARNRDQGSGSRSGKGPANKSI